MSKFVCQNRHCRWKGTDDELLRAPHPFVKDETLYGCPNCQDINCVVPACDHGDCWAEATCGTPTRSGYRNTCFNHRPKENAK